MLGSRCTPSRSQGHSQGDADGPGNGCVPRIAGTQLQSTEVCACAGSLWRKSHFCLRRNGGGVRIWYRWGSRLGQAWLSFKGRLGLFLVYSVDRVRRNKPAWSSRFWAWQNEAKRPEQRSTAEWGHRELADHSSPNCVFEVLVHPSNSLQAVRVRETRRIAIFPRESTIEAITSTHNTARISISLGIFVYYGIRFGRVRIAERRRLKWYGLDWRKMGQMQRGICNENWNELCIRGIEYFPTDALRKIVRVNFDCCETFAYLATKYLLIILAGWLQANGSPAL